MLSDVSSIAEVSGIPQGATLMQPKRFVVGGVIATQEPVNVYRGGNS